jgi:hypothetical protein
MTETLYRAYHRNETMNCSTGYQGQQGASSHPKKFGQPAENRRD